MEVNGEALQLHAVCKKPYFLLQVTQESISVLQVTQQSVSGTTNRGRASERTMKSKVRMIKSLLPSYQAMKISLVVAVGIVTCAAHS